jgi:hypothetical protein
MPGSGTKEGQSKPASFDIVDGIFCVGLVCILVGLGLAVGWGWGLTSVGIILTGYAIYLSIPERPAEVK